MTAIRSRPSRLFAATTAAALLGCALVLAPAPSAHAQGVDVLCEGTFEITFTPALTNTSQGTITDAEHVSYTTCETGLPGTSATSDSQPGETCVALLNQLAPYDEVITWQDGSTSTVTWSSIEDTVTGATYTGAVTAGRYTGDAATRVADGLTLAGDNPELCPLGDGTISGASGPVTLTLTSL